MISRFLRCPTMCAFRNLCVFCRALRLRARRGWATSCQFNSLNCPTLLPESVLLECVIATFESCPKSHSSKYACFTFLCWPSMCVFANCVFSAGPQQGSDASAIRRCCTRMAPWLCSKAAANGALASPLAPHQWGELNCTFV